MTDQILSEVEALGRLQFSLDEISLLMNLDITKRDRPQIEKAWQRGILTANREVRQRLYDAAAAGETGQAVAGFLKLCERWGAEPA